jgi:Alcohol dehydrogenase GroES-like domain
MAPTLPKTFKQAVFREQGGPLIVEEVDLKMPEKGEVLVKVEACGVCHSDVLTQHNVMGGGLYVSLSRSFLRAVFFSQEKMLSLEGFIVARQFKA